MYQTISGDVAYSLEGSSDSVVQINASVVPAGAGSIQGAGSYPVGSTVSLTAIPATGYGFVNWTEGPNTVSTSATYTFTASVDRTLVAHFTQAYIVTTSSSPQAGGTTSEMEFSIREATLQLMHLQHRAIRLTRGWKAEHRSVTRQTIRFRFNIAAISWLILSRCHRLRYLILTQARRRYSKVKQCHRARQILASPHISQHSASVSGQFKAVSCTDGPVQFFRVFSCSSFYLRQHTNKFKSTAHKPGT